MTVADLAIVAALIFVWGVLSARLERTDMTAPILFTVAGLVLTHGPLRVLSIEPSHESVKLLAEATLALVLFSDASRVGLRNLRADAGLCVRLLGIGLPLTIGLGTLLALALPGYGDIWLALLVGAALAPTDAALGASMMVNPVVPARIRRLINVESGLNDGIATPSCGGDRRRGRDEEAAHNGPVAALLELAIGVAIGWRLVPAGMADQGGPPPWLGGRRLRRCGGAGPRGLLLHHVGGAARQRLHRRVRGRARVRRHRPGRSPVCAVRRGDGRPGVAAGLAAVRRDRGGAGAGEPDLADCGLCRAQPDAHQDGAGGGGPAGHRAGRGSVVFVGWFGPRGLASVVFGLLALEALGEQAARPAVAVIAFTVLLSVVAHGLTADPLAKRFGPRLGPAEHSAGAAWLAPVPVRRLVRRSHAARHPDAAGQGDGSSQ